MKTNSKKPIKKIPSRIFQFQIFDELKQIGSQQQQVIY